MPRSSCTFLFTRLPTSARYAFHVAILVLPLTVPAIAPISRLHLRRHVPTDADLPLRLGVDYSRSGPTLALTQAKLPAGGGARRCQPSSYRRSTRPTSLV